MKIGIGSRNGVRHEVPTQMYSPKNPESGRIRHAPRGSKIRLLLLDPEVEVLDRFDAVARGDVVLVIELIGAVAGGPDAGDARALTARVGDDAFDRIHLDESLREIGIREDACFDENSRYGGVPFDSRVAIGVHEPSHELFALHFDRFGMCKDAHIRMRTRLLDGNRIGLEILVGGV